MVPINSTQPSRQIQVSKNLHSLKFGSLSKVNWQLIILGTGVSIAIAGGVFSFASHAIVQTITFVALAAILLFASYYVKNFSSDQAIQKNIQTLTKENLALKKDSKEMRENTDKLQKSAAKIEEINRDLKLQVAKVEQRVKDIEKINATLTKENQKLQQSTVNLKKLNVELQEKIDVLQRAIPLLRQQVEEFAQGNQMLAHHVGVF